MNCWSAGSGEQTESLSDTGLVDSAKAIGVKIPHTILPHTDRVIE